MSEELQKYKVILLSGCACFGAAHIGFLLALNNAHKLSFLKILSGTSVGSMIGLFYLYGFPIETIFKLYTTYNLSELLHITSSMNSVGIAKNTLVIAAMVDLLISHKKDPNISFEDLYQISSIIFVVTATQITNDSYQPVYFSVHTAPKMKIMDAIRASISIPLLFDSFTYNGNGYYDGALSDDLPFEYIQKTYGYSDEEMLGHSPISTSPSSKLASKDQNVGWISILISILKFTKEEVENLRSKVHRTVYTKIEGGSSLNMNMNVEISKFYFHRAILSTNRFIHSYKNTIRRTRSLSI